MLLLHKRNINRFVATRYLFRTRPLTLRLLLIAAPILIVVLLHDGFNFRPAPSINFVIVPPQEVLKSPETLRHDMLIEAQFEDVEG